MNEKLTPIDRPSQLADTPSHAPQFAVQVKQSSGEPLQVVDPRATRAMVALMDMNAVLGGAASHWGGPSAFAELMSALHGIMFSEAAKAKKPWHQLYNFVNDGGHCENGLYALKANYRYGTLTLAELRKFRSIESRLTGHGESHLFPEGVLLSNGPLGSAFPQAQGLAFADALADRKRVTVTAITDGACMEGEAREAMAAIPGLAASGKMAPFVLIISDNNTGLSGRLDEESYAMAPTFEALGDLGWEVFDLYDGHDLQHCVDMIEAGIQAARENPRKPVAIHARTVKGFGVKKTADSSSGGHGFPLKAAGELKAFLSEIYGGQEVPQVFLDWAAELEKTPANPGQPGKKVQVGVSAALIKKRQEGLPIISLSSDLPGSTGVAEFQKAFPGSKQDMGVCESNMISTAAGLSKAGFIPVVDTFAQFGVTKGALPLTMAALSQAPVIGIFSHVGFQDAADGASHQGLTYFGKTCAIPHTRVFALSCSEEAEALVSQAVDEFAAKMKKGETPDSFIFFLGRENFPTNYGVKNFKLGEAQVVRDSATPKVVVAAVGALLPQALEAAEELSKAGVDVAVINPSVINQPDINTFKKYLDLAGGRLVTVEDHQIIGGMGAILSHSLLQAGVTLKLRSLGVHGEFGQSAYNAIELYRKHGLDATAIAKAVRELI